MGRGVIAGGIGVVLLLAAGLWWSLAEPPFDPVAACEQDCEGWSDPGCLDVCAQGDGPAKLFEQVGPCQLFCGERRCRELCADDADCEDACPTQGARRIVAMRARGKTDATFEACVFECVDVGGPALTP